MFNALFLNGFLLAQDNVQNSQCGLYGGTVSGTSPVWLPQDTLTLQILESQVCLFYLPWAFHICYLFRGRDQKVIYCIGGRECRLCSLNSRDTLGEKLLKWGTGDYRIFMFWLLLQKWPRTIAGVQPNGAENWFRLNGSDTTSTLLGCCLLLCYWCYQ